MDLFFLYFIYYFYRIWEYWKKKIAKSIDSNMEYFGKTNKIKLYVFL